MISCGGVEVFKEQHTREIDILTIIAKTFAKGQLSFKVADDSFLHPVKAFCHLHVELFIVQTLS